MECAAAFRDDSPRVFRDGNSAMADVVVDFVVFIILKRKLHREVRFDCIVVDMTTCSLSHLSRTAATSAAVSSTTVSA